MNPHWSNPIKPGFPVNLIHEGKYYEFAFVSYSGCGMYCALAKVTDEGCEYILTDVDTSAVYPSTHKEPTGDVFDITPGSMIVKFGEFGTFLTEQYYINNHKFKVGEKVLPKNIWGVVFVVDAIKIVNKEVIYNCRFENEEVYDELVKIYNKHYYPYERTPFPLPIEVAELGKHKDIDINQVDLQSLDFDELEQNMKDVISRFNNIDINVRIWDEDGALWSRISACDVKDELHFLVGSHKYLRRAGPI